MQISQRLVERGRYLVTSEITHITRKSGNLALEAPYYRRCSDIHAGIKTQSVLCLHPSKHLICKLEQGFNGSRIMNSCRQYFSEVGRLR